MLPNSAFMKDLATEDVTGDAQWLTIGEQLPSSSQQRHRS